jgi:hypothetical protein
MRLIIAGGRDYRLSKLDLSRLDAIEGVTEVVSGACRGVDQDGEAWAAARGLPVARFPADWQKYGRSAGPHRNAAMASYGDAVALVAGGKGTESMYREAVAGGLRVFDFRAGDGG